MSGHNIIEKLRQAEHSYVDDIATAPITVDSGAPDADTAGYIYIRTDGTDEKERLYIRGDTTANDWVRQDSFVITRYGANDEGGGAATIRLGSNPVDAELTAVSVRYSTAQGATSNIVIKAAASGVAEGSAAALTGNIDGNAATDTTHTGTILAAGSNVTAGSLLVATCSAHDTLAGLVFSLHFRPV